MKKNSVWIRAGYRNSAENAFVEAAKAAGLTVTKRGWPDFIVYHPGGCLSFVEVKANRRQNLKGTQCRLAASLRRYGLPVITWTPGEPLPWAKRGE